MLLGGGSFSFEARAQLAGNGLIDNSLPVASDGFRSSVQSLVDGPTTSTVRPWSFHGDVDVEAGATDSPGGVGRGWQPLILIAPNFTLSGTSSRLNADLSYSPRLVFYPSTSSETLLSQNFNGILNAVVVPDLLFVTARGISSLDSRFGNTSLLSSSLVSRSEAVQTTSFSVSPYLQRTIGGAGTLSVGYTYAQTFQDSDNRFNNAFFAPNSAELAGFGTTGNLQTNTEFASFTTGENLGRIQNSISATASQYSGSYFYEGASTYSIVDRLSYSVSRWLTVFGTVGYQSYRYPRSRFELEQPTWTVGVTVTPNATSSITLQYGQVAGINTILANGTYTPTPRTRIFGGYTVDIQTGLGARQALLGSTGVGIGGIVTDGLTGAPSFANSYLASQSPLSRVTSATVGGALLLDRDAVTVSYTRTEFEQLGDSLSIFGVGTAQGTKTDTSFATINWQHELNPATTLSSGLTYATSNNGVFFGNPGGSFDTVQLYTSLNHLFTQSLSGSVSFNHSERLGSATRNLPAAFGGSASQNTILVGLRKSF